MYNDENLDVDVQFLIKRLEILQTDPPNLERSYNIDKYLASFCKVKDLKLRTTAPQLSVVLHLRIFLSSSSRLWHS